MVEAGFVVVAGVVGADCLFVVVVCVAGFVVVVVVEDFFVAGGGSSAGGGIGCGSGRDAPERYAQRNAVRNSVGRRTARNRNAIRKENMILPTRAFMRYAPGNVRMGFGSTKTAGRR